MKELFVTLKRKEGGLVLFWNNKVGQIKNI